MGLFQPDWKSKDQAKAMEGLKKLVGKLYFNEADRKKNLKKVALKASLPVIRLSAAKALVDHRLCYQMAKQDPDAGVRAYLISEDIFYAFCKKEELQNLLSTERDPAVRKLIQGLIDKKDLEAAEEQRKKDEAAAWERKQKSLKEEQAVKEQKVKEQLKNLSQQELSKLLCGPITEKLCGEDLGSEYVSRRILRESVQYLTEQQLICNVILNTTDTMSYIADMKNGQTDWTIQQSAAWLLEDQNLLEQLVFKVTQTSLRFVVLDRIENQRFLTDYLNTYQKDEFQLNKVDFTTMQNRMYEKSQLDKILKNRISDRALLEEIIHADSAFRDTADIKLQELDSQTLCPDGKHDWEEVCGGTDMYDNEIIIHEYTYRCSRCGAQYNYERWDNGHTDQSDVYFAPRIKKDTTAEKQ